MRKVVIVGGVAGGASTAARLRRLEKDTQIIIYERGEFISYANCGLPYYVGNVIQEQSELVVVTPETMKEKHNIDVKIKHEVIAIDKAKKELTVKDIVNDKLIIDTYDDLVIATGSSPLVPPILGIDLPNIYNVWTIPDSEAIKGSIKENGAKKVAVIGGGFIGIEMAENLKHLGLDVTIVEMASQILAPIDSDMVDPLHEHIREKGVELILNDGVKEFQKSGKGLKIITSKNVEIETDIVVLAIGVRPNSQIAKEAGLEIGARGGIIVDKTLRTSDKNIYAAGDVIEVEDFVNKVPTMIPLAGPANRQGRILANNLAGIYEEYKGTQGTAVVQVFDLVAASTGTNEKTLNRLGKVKGVDYEAISINALSHAHYYPNAQKMTIKVIFDLKNGKLLGAQIVGKENVAKRNDILATVIRYGGTMESLKDLELAYAPPFSSSKDPINTLGNLAEKFFK